MVRDILLLQALIQLMETLKEIIQKLEGDPYEILNTEPSADFLQLKKNYRSLALKYHPDRNKEEEATEQFIKINRAYQFLEDPANRKLYADHIKALEEAKKRIEKMGDERRTLIENLKRRQEEVQKRRQDMAAQVKRRKQFYDRKMKEEEDRQILRQQINKEMNPQQYYEEMSSIIVRWEKGLSFTSKLLQIAFNDYAEVIKVEIEDKRRKAVVIFNSLQKAMTVSKQFKHPTITVELLVSGQRRTRLLSALQKRKTDIDLSLSSENIERLKQLINRKSKFYFQNPLRSE